MGRTRSRKQARIYRPSFGQIQREATEPEPSLASLSRQLGPCVYFIRTADGFIKIGHTSNFASRKRAYGPDSVVLAVLQGTYDDEQALHSRFEAHRERGLEYYRPAPELIDHINSIRQRFNLSAIAA